MDFTAVGETLFFKLACPNPQLWKSDGTEAGTVMVKDIVPFELTAVDDTLFFVHYDGFFPFAGRSLWKSDGTSEGTVRIKEIPPTASELPLQLAAR